MEFLLNKDEENQNFFGEDIAIFKRYIEENDVYNDNSFEFFEKNLDYFSSRYTRNQYECMAENFHANSDFWSSEEMIRNIPLYESSVRWRNATVHPENSEYVIKEEKYLFLDSLSDKFCRIVTALNELPEELFSCVDLLFYVEGSIYQYLPRKNFVFTWEKNGIGLIEFMSEQLLEELSDRIVAIPIFAPIRKMLFLGEYGYREAMIDYGRVLSEISYSAPKFKLFRRFENRVMNQKFRLDGIEKSILTIISC